MSSILTNNGAMVALQTLKSINSNLGKVQSEISTGKTVESAKDNAAVWAISKVMASDVEGFKAITDSLSLGQATVGVAVNGAETITDLLTEIKAKIVNSQEENVDRVKIQTDIEALNSQIGSIVSAAQFNGLNLLNNDGIATDDQSSNILSSLDRASDGTVSSGEISVTRSNLGTDTASYLESATTYAAGSAAGGGAIAATVNASSGAGAVIGVTGTAITQTEGTVFVLQLTGTDADASNFTAADYTTQDGADGNTADIAYVAQEGDTAVEVAAGLKAAFDVWRVDNGLDVDDFDIADDGDGSLTGSSANGMTDATDTIAFQVNVRDSDLSDGATTRAGALSMLGAIDVSTDQGAEDALNAIEGLIQTSIDTASQLGSSSRQINTQAEFVGKLSDLLTSGIGTLVDADMEAASAKLQALQTQQQLGVQALSIANQAPQTILSLFR